MRHQIEQMLMRRIVPAAPKADPLHHQAARYRTVRSVVRTADATSPAAFTCQHLCRPQTIQTQLLPSRQRVSPCSLKFVLYKIGRYRSTEHQHHFCHKNREQTGKIVRTRDEHILTGSTPLEASHRHSPADAARIGISKALCKPRLHTQSVTRPAVGACANGWYGTG